MDVSPSTNSRRTSGSVILCGCLGIAGLVASYLVSNWYDWTPASFPINLRPGISKSQPFRLTLTDFYWISLTIKRVLPQDRLRCILGIQPGPDNRCEPQSSLVKIRWSVLASGRLIAKGESEDDVAGSWSNEEVERPLGKFRGERGAEYVVTIESVVDGSELDVASPRIVIGVHPFSYKSYAVVAQGLVLISVVLIVAFVLLMIRSRVKGGGDS